jgi:hypothetical protein
VNTAAVETMASGWGVLVGELNALVSPPTVGLSCQPSAAAVTVAHANTAAFTEALAAQVRVRATHAVAAGQGHLVNEANSAAELGAVDV